MAPRQRKKYAHQRWKDMAKKMKEKIYLRFAERKSWVKAVYIDNTEYINIGHKTNKKKETYSSAQGRKENK